MVSQPIYSQLLCALKQYTVREKLQLQRGKAIQIIGVAGDCDRLISACFMVIYSSFGTKIEDNMLMNHPQNLSTCQAVEFGMTANH